MEYHYTSLVLSQPPVWAPLHPRSPPPSKHPSHPPVLVASLPRHLPSPPTASVSLPRLLDARAPPVSSLSYQCAAVPISPWQVAVHRCPAAPLLPKPRRHRPWDRLPSPVPFFLSTATAVTPHRCHTRRHNPSALICFSYVSLALSLWVSQ